MLSFRGPWISIEDRIETWLELTFSILDLKVARWTAKRFRSRSSSPILRSMDSSSCEYVSLLCMYSVKIEI